MITDALVDQVIAAMEAAGVPKDSRFERNWVLDKVVQYTPDAIRISYLGSREMPRNHSIDPAWLTPFFVPTFDAANQVAGAKWIRFVCPKPMSLEEKTSGFQFVGKLKDMRNWTEYGSLGKAVDAMNAKDITSENIGYTHDGIYLYLFGDNSIRNPDVQMIAADPRTIPTWDILTDPYPIDEKSVGVMLEVMFRREFRLELARPQKVVNNENPNTP